jgi:EAL domain-containing protein (putative c-di-GMP-specific phosphodiesterase class I)
VPLAEGGSTPEDILRAANASMRAAKANGPGSRQRYDPALKSKPDAASRSAPTSSQALPAKELTTLIQPQIDLNSGRMIGGEVLLRWNHAGKFIPPSEFIPIAEQSALIHKIGQAVIDQAFAALAALAQAGREDLTLSINVAARIRERRLRHGAAGALRGRRHPAVAHRTGTAGNRGDDPLRPHLRPVEPVPQAGGAVAIDDFGTGMSSLAYLMELPHDRIKIDRGFIAKLNPARPASASPE